VVEEERLAVQIRRLLGCDDILFEEVLTDELFQVPL